MKNPTRCALLTAVCLAAMVAAGCGGKSVWVRQYPAFYTPEIKTVAVLPFENRSPQIGAGGIFADHLARALRANGTYKVLGPRQARAAVTEEDLAAGPGAVAAKLRKDGRADAFIVGTVDRYSGMTYPYATWHTTLGVGHHRHGWGWDVYYDIPETIFVSRARVVVSAAIVRVADGEMLYATPVPLHASVDAEDYAPVDPQYAMMGALGQAVARVVERVAVVPVKIRLKSDKHLKIAAGREHGRWDHEKTFHADDDEMFVIPRLPRAAERNPFRVTITPKGEEDHVLAEQAFVWSPEVAEAGLVFSPRAIAGAAGTGTYRVNLYADRDRVMKRTFKIKD